MASIFLWILTISVSVATVVFTAASREVDNHAIATGIVSLAIAIIAIFEHNRLAKHGASEHAIAASTASHMGFVWAWGALSLFATYYPGFKIIRWEEANVFTMVAILLAVLCLFFAAILRRDEKSGADDTTFLDLAAYLSYAQLIGMVVAMIGLVADGKIPAKVQKSPDWQDWAANNVFFFGALALFIITANALLARRRRLQATSAG